MDISLLRTFTEDIARRAGAVLLQHWRRMQVDHTEFKGRRELVTFADRASEQLLVEAIHERYPDHAVLAEEGAASPRGVASSASDWLWVIDPLDGTTNFIHGHPFFSIAIAVQHRGKPVLGVVHAPGLDELYCGVPGVGAWCNGEAIRVTATATLRDALVATGFSYDRNELGHRTNLDEFARMTMVARDVRRCGSAALDLAYVAAGRYDAYWEFDLMPYDIQAGAFVVLAAGGKVSDLQGGDAGWLAGKETLASNGRLHAELLAMVKG
jgi:myo-inositol-1(or 4)-monophosphatase